MPRLGGAGRTPRQGRSLRSFNCVFSHAELQNDVRFDSSMRSNEQTEVRLPCNVHALGATSRRAKCR